MALALQAQGQTAWSMVRSECRRCNLTVNDDTDTLIALVSSLLPQCTYSQDATLDALVQSNGDVEATVEALRQSKRPCKKRNFDS